MPFPKRHFAIALLLLAGTAGVFCQTSTSGKDSGTSSRPNAGALPLDTESHVVEHFVAVHGRHSFVDGYASQGLEFWAGPFQLLSGYRVAFREEGATTLTRDEDILLRITYAPHSITRVYAGPDFSVRETLFVPLEEPGAIVTYQVDSARTIDIEVHATPVLDLMWPAAIGGQSAAWNTALSAYLLSEPTYGYTAVAGSPDQIAHTDGGNRTVHGVDETGIGFTLLPNSAGIARVFVALNPPHASDPGALMESLIRDRVRLESDAAAHYAQLTAHALQIETPDPQVNHALAWAETALDQAWVCNDQLGCGIVAGYGPSRLGRRPQYAWFFAGDGLVATEALLSEGEYARARQELAFILRWQDAKTGMIWHELSQSAGFLDWAGKYPYMFVHVDITFQFLITLERYVTASGDIPFLRENWSAINAAENYCRSLIDPAVGLPRIPANREAGDEQDRESDDLGLSASWSSASQAFAHMAALTGHTSESERATNEATLARNAIPARYWDPERSFWIQGHSATGLPLPERRSSPAGALAQNLFSAKQTAAILDQIASASFQTDWGTRTLGAASAGYDSESYAKGSVFAVGTADLAVAYWAEHRPAIALQLWNSLLPLSSLDSMGHLHEVLAGNFYRPQLESVPEQTWSSAGFLTATVHGLLGIEVDAIDRRIVFAPHLPAGWPSVLIRNLRFADKPIGLSLSRVSKGFALDIENADEPFHIEFAPEIPLGSRLLTALLDNRPIAATLRTNLQDQHAVMAFDVPHGHSELRVSFTDGVSVDVPAPRITPGDSSTGLHLVGVSMANRVLTLVADVPNNHDSKIELHTQWQIAKAQGVSAQRVSDDSVELTFVGLRSTSKGTTEYASTTATVQFAPAD